MGRYGGRKRQRIAERTRVVPFLGFPGSLTGKNGQNAGSRAVPQTKTRPDCQTFKMGTARERGVRGCYGAWGLHWCVTGSRSWLALGSRGHRGASDLVQTDWVCPLPIAPELTQGFTRLRDKNRKMNVTSFFISCWPSWASLLRS